MRPRVRAVSCACGLWVQAARAGKSGPFFSARATSAESSYASRRDRGRCYLTAVGVVLGRPQGWPAPLRGGSSVAMQAAVWGLSRAPPAWYNWFNTFIADDAISSRHTIVLAFRVSPRFSKVKRPSCLRGVHAAPGHGRGVPNAQPPSSAATVAVRGGGRQGCSGRPTPRRTGPAARTGAGRGCGWRRGLARVCVPRATGTAAWVGGGAAVRLRCAL